LAAGGDQHWPPKLSYKTEPMSESHQSPATQPNPGKPAGTRLTFTCPNCGNGFSVTFPPGAPMPKIADSLCTFCRLARDAKLTV
jgi:hypothetical protein